MRITEVKIDRPMHHDFLWSPKADAAEITDKINQTLGGSP